MLSYLFLALPLFLFYHFYWKRRNLPGGPIPFPFLGNFIQFAYYGVEEAVLKFQRDYGDLHTIWFGERPIVVIADYPTVVETYIKNGDAYAGSIDDSLLGKIANIGGITMTQGEVWKEQRKFVLRTLRDLGVGKDVMQQKILTEIGFMFEDIKEELDKGKEAMDIQDHVDKAVGSVINSAVIGYRFGKDKEKEFSYVKTSIAKSFEAAGHPLWHIIDNTTEYLKYLPGFSTVYNNLATNLKNAHGYIANQIKDHQKTFDPENDEPTDFVEAYLHHQRKLEKEGQIGHTFTNKQLNATAHDLWVAGQETTSTTLAWLLNYVTTRPEIQARIHQELDRVIGSDRYITVNDKVNLPYLCAVISEAQRYGSIGILNLIHKTTENVEIHGHKLPKGTAIVFSLTSILQDERYFKTPEKFNPDRFLDADGKYFAPPEFVPFSAGKRVCAGIALAQMELFLFTANIFNQYRFAEIPEKPISTKRIIGFTIVPEHFVVSMKPRW